VKDYSTILNNGRVGLYTFPNPNVKFDPKDMNKVGEEYAKSQEREQERTKYYAEHPDAKEDDWEKYEIEKN